MTPRLSRLTNLPPPNKIYTAAQIEENKKEAEEAQAANDNVIVPPEPPSMAFLRKAIDAPTIGEVVDMIHNEMESYHCFENISVKIDDTQLEPQAAEPRHYLFPEILTVVANKLYPALIGPAGAGKSTVCEQVANTLGKKFFLQVSVSGTHELTGYMDAHGRYQSTAFRACFEQGGLILLDEVDSSDAGALKWINTALANGHAVFPDRTDPVKRHDDFRIIIAANTYGNGADRLYVGANQLDASTLDRFVFLDFRYDEKLEAKIAGNLQWVRRVQSLRRAASLEKARMVISPRASIHGSKLLAAGWQQSIVEDRTIWKDTDPELRKRIEKRAA